MEISTRNLELARGVGSQVWTTEGTCYTDMVIGFGAVFLGHCNPYVTHRLQDQVSKIWHSGRNTSPGATEAYTHIQEILPVGLRAAGLYSTGMEVIEFAMRLAALNTGRQEFTGFSKSMHGKSAMTAALCWNNAPVTPALVHTLPFVDQVHEDIILERLRDLLCAKKIAAVVVEPIQGSNHGHEASIGFYERLITLCHEYGTCSIFDETLTGLYRTGSRFYIDRLAKIPDFLVFAKSMANGFPIASIAIPDGMQVDALALPGSTYSGNPLAAAAVAGTLEAMSDLPMLDMVALIERTVRLALAGIEANGTVLRGRGAIWVLEMNSKIQIEGVLQKIRAAGVIVSSHGNQIRILPAVNMELALLKDACSKIADACVPA